MIDLKTFNSALDQLEEERGIPKEKILEAIEQALAAAYKKDYGKKGQIVRGRFDPNTGAAEFTQVKIAVDESIVRMPEEDTETEERKAAYIPDSGEEEFDARPRFNPEHHILIDDARKIKKGVELEEEIVFPLETKEDYGRIAAQTAKQVIIQKIREAEKTAVLSEYTGKRGEIVSGIVQRVERGNAFVELGRTVAMLPAEEQIPGEHYRQGGRIKAFVVDAVEGPRGVNIRLSRSHPDFIKKLFAVESPEIANGIVEIKSIAREPGSRSKIAVASNDDKIDPIGACVGGRGARVSAVMGELAGEKIDIIEWSENPATFIGSSLSPAKIIGIILDEEARRAKVTVVNEQLSLAIGKGGQNVRLAAKLTGWKIDIEGAGGEIAAASDGDGVEILENKAGETAPETLLEELTHEMPAAEIQDDQATTPEQTEKEEAETEGK